MTTAQRRAKSAAEGAPPDIDLTRSSESTPSVGELMSEIAADLSGLMRQEIELAKAEVREEAKKAARAGAMLGGGTYLAHLAGLSLVAAVIIGLGHLTGHGWAALVVAVVLGAAAGFLAMSGKQQLSRVSPKPERTVQTLEEDLKWARHPRS